MCSKNFFRDITEEQNHTNSYSRLVTGQKILEIPSFCLECGEELVNFPVAYKTWGRLNKDRDNVIVIFHALTGLSDVLDWWGPLLGTGKTFDPSRFLIVCVNLLGSPYGSFSPVTVDKETLKPLGPLFPLVTIKDEVKIQKLVFDYLGINSIACVIGGSMGGMIALEYSAAYNNTGYVKTVIALATSARASAWCISWNETQRQCIFSDPNYMDGYYYEHNVKPDSGLSAARMAALLTYRSRNSFETRFGRGLPNKDNSKLIGSETKPVRYPANKEEENWLLHNHGSISSASSGISSSNNSDKPQIYFTAQSYLRYQGTKFIRRFDANCYISITRKLDTHDITRGRIENDYPDEDPLPDYLATLKTPHLVIGIESDGLFTFSEQQYLHKHLPDCTLKKLTSPEGHDAFLLEFAIIDEYCKEFLKSKIPEYYDNSGKVELFEDWHKYVKSTDNGGNSVFGESEKNITNW